jgi:PAS domain S-box-containing protein
VEPEVTEAQGRPRLTLRRLLAVALGGVAVHVVALTLTVILVFLPRITALRMDTQSLIAEMEGYASESVRLDSIVAQARGELASQGPAVAASTLRTALESPAVAPRFARAEALADAPLEMRSALAAALSGESTVRDLISEGIAHLDLGDTQRADLAMARAGTAAVDLVSSLARAQGAGLRDVARRGLALEQTVTQASRSLVAWAGLGLLFVALVAILLHLRLYVPLRILDVGIRALSQGTLEHRVDPGRQDELGRMATLLNQTADVLQQRDAERLRERKEMTRQILDSALDAVITIDPGGIVTGWNSGAETVFGWSAEEMVGERLDRIIPPDYVDRHNGGLRKYRLVTEAPLLNRRTEMPAIRRDGTSFTVELSIVPLVENGHKVAYTAFLRDVTEQRSAERAIRKSEKLLRGIVDNTSAIISMKDLDRRYVLVNRRFCDVFGVQRDDVLGSTVRDVATPETAEEAHAHDTEVLRTLRATHFEETLNLPEGPRHYLAVRFPLLDESGEPYGVAGIATDMTESMELEERVRRSQRLEAVGRLAGGIAHDFNNLVTIILGQTQLALEEDTKPEVRAGLEEIEKAADRAASLTGQLLAFARKQIITPQRMDVNDLVRDTLGMLHRVIEATVHIRTDLDPDAGHVFVDPGHFSQVLLNLVINSRDAMGTSGGVIIISTRRPNKASLDTPPGDYVLLSVEDNGPGIPEEVLQRIFEPFFTTKPMGTGLGLSTCYGIVNQAGGGIQAFNRDRGGARFRVWLPKVVDADAAPTADPPPAHTP